jgi:hypothetical protein
VIENGKKIEGETGDTYGYHPFIWMLLGVNLRNKDDNEMSCVSKQCFAMARKISVVGTLAKNVYVEGGETNSKASSGGGVKISNTNTVSANVFTPVINNYDKIPRPLSPDENESSEPPPPPSSSSTEKLPPPNVIPTKLIPPISFGSLFSALFSRSSTQQQQSTSHLPSSVPPSSSSLPHKNYYHVPLFCEKPTNLRFGPDSLFFDTGLFLLEDCGCVDLAEWFFEKVYIL